jgi:hypothetical protein
MVIFLFAKRITKKSPKNPQKILKNVHDPKRSRKGRKHQDCAKGKHVETFAGLFVLQRVD